MGACVSRRILALVSGRKKRQRVSRAVADHALAFRASLSELSGTVTAGTSARIWTLMPSLKSDYVAD
jgi:hypothetical protein